MENLNFLNITHTGKTIQEVVWQQIQDEDFVSAFSPALSRPGIKLFYVIHWLVVHFPFTLVLFSILKVVSLGEQFYLLN